METRDFNFCPCILLSEGGNGITDIGEICYFYMSHNRHREICCSSHLFAGNVSFLGLCGTCAGACDDFMVHVGACGDVGVAVRTRLCHIFLQFPVLRSSRSSATKVLRFGADSL